MELENITLDELIEYLDEIDSLDLTSLKDEIWDLYYKLVEEDEIIDSDYLCMLEYISYELGKRGD